MKLTRLRPAGAKHCFLLRTGMAVAYFREMFDRPDAMLKVFDLDEVTEEQGLEVAKWGDDPRKGEPRLNSNLIDATRIQNIAAFHGLAPWVYGLGTISLANKLVPVQITEDVGTFRESAKNNDDAESVYRKVVELGKKYGFGIEKEDVSTSDVINGKLVDFQTFAFNKDYKETVKEMYIAGKYGKVYYQDVPELGLSGGPRKTVERFTTLGLDKIDFKDKVVLDVGCAGGSFLRYAIKHGAKRGIGIDIDKGELEAAFHVSNWLGKYNIDYVNLDVVEYKIEDFNLKPVETEMAALINPALEPLAEIYEALKTGLRDYVHKNGFEKVVIGLSGGIDSALTATICADALGAENVIGVTMPSRYSSKGTLGRETVHRSFASVP